MEISEISEKVRRMAREFQERDRLAVEAFNNNAAFQSITLESRLTFVEMRLFDTAGTLFRALEKIAEALETKHQEDTE